MQIHFFFLNLTKDPRLNSLANICYKIGKSNKYMKKEGGKYGSFVELIVNSGFLSLHSAGSNLKEVQLSSCFIMPTHARIFYALNVVRTIKLHSIVHYRKDYLQA